MQGQRATTVLVVVDCKGVVLVSSLGMCLGMQKSSNSHTTLVLFVSVRKGVCVCDLQALCGHLGSIPNA